MRRRYTVMEDTPGALRNEIDSKFSEIDNNYQTPTILGTQIRLTKKTNTSRLFFKLNSELNGLITVSTDNGLTSKNLVDVDGVQVTSLEKGFAEVVAESNFFILRNRGMSKNNLLALIAIANEVESNENVVKTNYINAIQSTDDSISLPSDATWNDMLLQIPNINASNKKWASGSFATSSTGTVSVSGLDFIPSTVIFYGYYLNSGINPAYACGVITKNFPVNIYENRRVIGSFGGAATGANINQGNVISLPEPYNLDEHFYYGGFAFTLGSVTGRSLNYIAFE